MGMKMRTGRNDAHPNAFHAPLRPHLVDRNSQNLERLMFGGIYYKYQKGLFKIQGLL